MAGIDNRIKKMETALSDIRFDDQAYIDAFMSFYRGDEGKALAALPEYKGSFGQEGALIVTALSRVKNEARENEGQE